MGKGLPTQHGRDSQHAGEPPGCATEQNQYAAKNDVVFSAVHCQRSVRTCCTASTSLWFVTCLHVKHTRHILLARLRMCANAQKCMPITIQHVWPSSWKHGRFRLPPLLGDAFLVCVQGLPLSDQCCLVPTIVWPQPFCPTILQVYLNCLPEPVTSSMGTVSRWLGQLCM